MEWGFLSDESAKPGFARFREQPADGFEKVRDVQGLFEQGAHTGTERGEELERARGGDNDGQQWVLGAESLKGVPTVSHRHIKVEDDQVHGESAGDGDRFVAVSGWPDEEPFFR